MMTALPSLTQDAQNDLKRYLGRVKSALRPHPSVDADDVEHEIRGHIEAELEGAATPVTAERLRSVLDRLGSPGDWVPTDELPAWRKLLLHLSSGREDWRLAYLALGLFVGCPLLGPAAPLAFFASILVARAGLALLDERGEPAGARKWFLYPPLLFIYIDLAIVALVLPPGILLGLAADPQLPQELFAARDFFLGWLPRPVLAERDLPDRDGRGHVVAWAGAGSRAVQAGGAVGLLAVRRLVRAAARPADRAGGARPRGGLGHRPLARALAAAPVPLSAAPAATTAVHRIARDRVGSDRRPGREFTGWGRSQVRRDRRCGR